MTLQGEPVPGSESEVPHIPKMHDGRDLSETARDVARVAHMAHFHMPPNGVPGELSAAQSEFLRNVEKSAKSLDPEVHIDTSEQIQD